MRTNIEGIPLHCGNCGYNWKYAGVSTFYATCPRCKSSVKIPKKESKTESVPLAEHKLGGMAVKLK